MSCKRKVNGKTTGRDRVKSGAHGDVPATVQQEQPEQLHRHAASTNCGLAALDRRCRPRSRDGEVATLRGRLEAGNSRWIRRVVPIREAAAKGHPPALARAPLPGVDGLGQLRILLTRRLGNNFSRAAGGPPAGRSG
jgi:hypothetical protein